MGLLDGLRELRRGVLTPVKPAAGLAPAGESTVRDRLLAIAGSGIETSERDGHVVISWSVSLTAAGPGAVASEDLYRAIEIELDASSHVARALCVTDTAASRAGAQGSGMTRTWGRGVQLGSERRYVLPWFGQGGRGYRFSWSDLRRPVIDAVTGAGWTYRPRRG